jgi:putative membrane protein
MVLPTALIVAVVLGLLNIFYQTILVLLTLPVTAYIRLFLLIINALMIVLCSQIVDGFKVETLRQ